MLKTSKTKWDKSQDDRDLRGDSDSKRDTGGYLVRFYFMSLLSHEK